MNCAVRFKDRQMEMFYRFEARLATRPIIEFIEKHGDKCRGVLVDVGCGTKPYMDYFRNIERYIGLDIAGGEADVLADANYLPIKDSSVDAVLCNQLLEHCKKPRRILEEISRVLRKGGILILSAPQMSRLHGTPEDYYRFTRWGLKYLLEESGLNIEIIEPHGGFFRAIGSHINFFMMDYLGRNELLKNMIRHTILSANNFIFVLLDKLINWKNDTLGYNVIAKKVT